ncbi:MAG: hypothetical protein ACP5QT_03955 [Brevinematia bacterium]
MKKFVFFLIFLYGYLYAIKWEVGFNFEYGVFSIYEVSYNLFRFSPKFELESFKLCYGIDFIYDTNGNFLNTRWNNWQMILSRLEYAEFNNPFFSLDIRSVENFTLGDGLIVKNLSTRKFFPFFYYPMGTTGLNFDFLSFNLFTDNIIDFDIMGANIVFKPLYFFTQSIWKDISIGISTVADFDPYNVISYDTNTKEYTFEDNYSNLTVLLYRINGSIPLMKNKFFTISFNSSYAGIYEKGSGVLIGINGVIFGVMKYGYDYGFFGKKFLSHYIDLFYEKERNHKFQKLDEINEDYNYYRILTGLTLFENMMDVDFEYCRELRNNVFPEVYFSISLDKRYFKVLDLSVGYYRPDFEKVEDFFVAFYNTSYLFIDLNFFMSETINFGFEYRYYFYNKENNESPYNSIYLFLTSYF